MRSTASWITLRTHPDGAEACVRNTNISVWALIERQRLGMSSGEILKDVQGLTPEDLETAEEYYRAHAEEIDRAIRINACA